MKRAAGLVFAIVAACGGSAPPNATSDDAGTAVPETGPTYASLGDSLSLDTVAVFQAVKATVISGGAKPTKVNAPVVANRPALVRVYVAPNATFAPKQLSAELRIASAGMDLVRLTDAKMITVASTDKDLTSTFNFNLKPEQLPADATFSITIHDPSIPVDRPEGSIAYPGDGSLDELGADSSGDSLKLTIVPVRYDTDSSGRLPDVSDQQIQRYHDTIYKMYPAAKVDISVHAAWPWNQTIEANGTGWDDLLNALIELRQSDGAAKDNYYIAAFEPAPSMQDYCNGGCILGIAPLTSAFDVMERVAMIVGYTGQSPANTLNQELAHAMGRDHAPCGGAGGPDPKYPYPNGRIGVWGWDLLANKLVDPASQSRDFMGYCYPIWISDYTYSGLFTRMRFVSNTSKFQQGAPQTLQTLLVGKSGAVRWGRTIATTDLGTTDPGVHVSFLAANGSVMASSPARFVRYDSLEGGMVVVPQGPFGFARARIEGLPSGVVELTR